MKHLFTGYKPYGRHGPFSIPWGTILVTLIICMVILGVYK